MNCSWREMSRSIPLKSKALSSANLWLTHATIDKSPNSYLSSTLLNNFMKILKLKEIQDLERQSY